MSMYQWDLIEQALMVVMGASFALFLLSSKGKD